MEDKIRENAKNHANALLPVKPLDR